MIKPWKNDDPDDVDDRRRSSQKFKVVDVLVDGVNEADDVADVNHFDDVYVVDEVE